MQITLFFSCDMYFLIARKIFWGKELTLGLCYFAVIIVWFGWQLETTAYRWLTFVNVNASFPQFVCCISNMHRVFLNVKTFTCIWLWFWREKWLEKKGNITLSLLHIASYCCYCLPLIIHWKECMGPRNVIMYQQLNHSHMSCTKRSKTSLFNKYASNDFVHFGTKLLFFRLNNFTPLLVYYNKSYYVTGHYYIEGSCYVQNESQMLLLIQLCLLFHLRD